MIKYKVKGLHLEGEALTKKIDQHITKVFLRMMEELSEHKVKVTIVLGGDSDHPVFMKPVDNPHIIRIYVGAVCADGPIVRTDFNFYGSSTQVEKARPNINNMILSARDDVGYFDTTSKSCYYIGRTVFIPFSFISALEVESLREFIKDPDNFAKHKQSLHLVKIFKDRYAHKLYQQRREVEQAATNYKNAYQNYLANKEQLELKRIQFEAYEKFVNNIKVEDILNSIADNLKGRPDVKSVSFHLEYIKIELNSIVCSDSRKSGWQIKIPPSILYIMFKGGNLRYGFHTEFPVKIESRAKIHPHIIYDRQRSPEDNKTPIFEMCLGDMEREIQMDLDKWDIEEAANKLINGLYFYNSNDSAGAHFRNYPKA